MYAFIICTFNAEPFKIHFFKGKVNIADYIFFIERGEKVFCEPKDDILESWLLVKGGPEDLTPELEAALIGVEKHDYGFEALYPTDSAMALPPEVTAEKPTIDQIVIHILEGRE